MNYTHYVYIYIYIEIVILRVWSAKEKDITERRVSNMTYPCYMSEWRLRCQCVMIVDYCVNSLWITVFQRPITTICWGHRDSRLFLACGPALYVVRVEHRVASLQLLCQQGIASALREEKDVGKLNMPSLLCSYVTSAFIPTIKVHWSLINCYVVTVIGSFLPNFVALW